MNEFVKIFSVVISCNIPASCDMRKYFFLIKKTPNISLYVIHNVLFLDNHVDLPLIKVES